VPTRYHVAVGCAAPQGGFLRAAAVVPPVRWLTRHTGGACCLPARWCGQARAGCGEVTNTCGRSATLRGCRGGPQLLQACTSLHVSLAYRSEARGADLGAAVVAPFVTQPIAANCRCRKLDGWRSSQRIPQRQPPRFEPSRGTRGAQSEPYRIGSIVAGTPGNTSVRAVVAGSHVDPGRWRCARTVGWVGAVAGSGGRNRRNRW